MSTETELATYRDYLDHYRATLERQCAGLSPEQLATRSVPPSNLSLLGLVRHLAYVEHTWFQRALRGNLAEPRPFTGSEDHDLEFNGAVGTPLCVEEALDAWRHEIGRADEWLATRTDEDMATVVVYNGDGETTPIRDVLVHLIEEYARHCGHADLLREAIDGRTGL